MAPPRQVDAPPKGSISVGWFGGQVHQADALLLAAQFAADAQVERERLLDVAPHERLLDRDILEVGREGGVAAVVAPVGIENPEFGFIGVAALAAEVVDHLAQVVGVHRQAVALAVGLQLLLAHLAEAFEHRHELHLGMLEVGQTAEVLLARLDGVDVVVADAGQLLVGHAVVEEQQLGRTDVDPGRGVNQPHAVDGRRGALVELAGKELHGDVLAPLQVA